MPEHDSSYRQLFSTQRMVKDLLTGFVHEDWVSELDFESLEAVETSFVSEGLRKREADVIWRVKWNNRWLYLYVLIEMQSTVDPMMAVRLMTYIGLLYQDLAAQKKLTEDGLLPPVLPITVYNGGPKWSAPLSLSEMIASVPRSMERYLPKLSYFLLDERHLSADSLPRAQNLVSSLIKLENSDDGTIVLEAFDELMDSLNQDSHEITRLQRTFLVWLRQTYLPSRCKGMDIPNLSNLLEVRKMLEKIPSWTENWHQQGIEQGREEERAEVAKNMIRGGFETEVIHQATGLSLEAIEALRAEIS